MRHCSIAFIAGSLLVGCTPTPWGADDDVGGDDDVWDDDAGDDDVDSDICDDYPGEIICDGETAVTCDMHGDVAGTEDCDTANDFHCWQLLGCVMCYPGTRWCDGNLVMECAADGQSASVAEQCDTAAGEVCDNGACITLCEQAEQEGSTIGCEFFAVDLDQHDSGPETIQYAVALSNTDVALTAQVEVATYSNGAWVGVWNDAVGPHSLATVLLNDKHVDDTAIHEGGAYRITSNIPIIAYQFNPVDGGSSYLSDASLLLPVAAYDSVYRVPGWDEANDGFGNQHSSLNVVASVDGTTVIVTPTCNTLAGSGVPASSPGVPIQVTLDQGDYLQVASNGSSLAGTLVETHPTTPVAVFAGHECALIPTNYCCCDHLEEQVFGIQTWGESYVAARIPHRGPPAEDILWQIIAGNDPVSLTFDAHGDVTGLPGPTTLQPGDELRIWVTGSASNPGDFSVSGTDAFLLVQYMVSAYASPNSSLGDPAMVQAVPVEQYLDSYVVLVPGTWDQDYMIITRAAGATVAVDGTSIDAWTGWSEAAAIGSSGYEAVRIAVTDGVHVLDGSDPFGVVVVGFDMHDSYAYPGGLDQEQINDL